MSGLKISGIQNALVSHALTLGEFDQVSGHEPKNAPGTGLWAAVFLSSGEPVGEISGLDAASARVAFDIRVSQNMLQEPQDDIDPRIAGAVDTLMAAYCADFTLGGLIRNVDVFGETGRGLFFDAGYFEQDHKHYRAVVVTVPMIVNDVWSLTP